MILGQSDYFFYQKYYPNCFDLTKKTEIKQIARGWGEIELVYFNHQAGSAIVLAKNLKDSIELNEIVRKFHHSLCTTYTNYDI